MGDGDGVMGYYPLSAGSMGAKESKTSIKLMLSTKVDAIVWKSK